MKKNKSEKQQPQEPEEQSRDHGPSQDRSQQSQTTQSGEWKRPLTNQDKQRQTTNSENTVDSGLNEEETEGDRERKKVKAS